MKKIIIAIDGHASCGKSTFAKAIAERMHYKYIDSGAMYRAVTLFALKNNLITNNVVDCEKLAAILSAIKIELRYNEQKDEYFTLLNGENVEREIRGIEVTSNVSNVSKIKAVRQRLIIIQQEIGKEKGIVMDGRDIGSVVFPEAEFKIFLTASPQVRAMRRYKEMAEKGEKIEYDEVLKNVQLRDHIDATRAESPLIKAPDAHVLDNSNMTLDEQLVWFDNILEDIKLKTHKIGN